MTFYIIGILVGILLSSIGIPWLIKMFRLKEIKQFSIHTKSKIIAFNKKGLYGINIHPTGAIVKKNGFKINLYNQNTNESITVKENLMPYGFVKNGRNGLEYAQFKIEAVGDYKIEIQNAISLKVQSQRVNSSFGSKSFFSKEISNDEINIIIKTSTPNYQKLFGIIFTVVGINIIIFSCIQIVMMNKY